MLKVLTKVVKYARTSAVVVLSLAVGTATLLPALTLANGNPGLTIFSGVDRKDILDYYLQFGGRPRQMDRYKLYIPAKKLSQGASTFFLSYPDYYNGEFDTNKIEVRVNGQSQPLKEVIWDKDSRIIQIVLEKPIDPTTRVELVLSNVKNPELGTYYFTCDVIASGNIPVRLYVGTWIVSISP
jgi:Protein of unknown function (DUF2808)